MANAKKQWLAPRIERLTLSQARLAELFPHLTNEERDRIAAQAGEGQ